jgi:hypothetical protein
VTVNTYLRGPRVASDIVVGPAPVSHRWINFAPMIAEFLTDDLSCLVRSHAGVDARARPPASRAAGQDGLSR